MQIISYKGISVSSIEDLMNVIATEASRVVGCDGGIILSKLTERERISPTAIGKGVLLPHIRLEKAEEDFIFFFILSDRLKYNTPDGVDIGLVFFIASPMEKKTEYLKLVSSVVRLIKNEQILDDIIFTEDLQAIKSKLFEHLQPKRN